MTDCEGNGLLDIVGRWYSEADYAALEAENKRLREEVKFCKSCFKHNPCGNAIKEQDMLEESKGRILALKQDLDVSVKQNHRYKEALEKIKVDTHNRPGREHWNYYCMRLHKILMIAMEALEAQDADK